MTALVTGATGFVGSHTARRLVAMGEDVHILVRKSSPYPRIDDIRERMTLHEGDITDAESLAHIVSAVSPDAIFHFASAGMYSGVSAPAEQLMEVNAKGLENLLTALREHPYKAFVNIGSASEYGPKTAPMREDDACEPASTYAISKLAATEFATAEANEYGKPIATFRLFSPYGPADDPARLIMQAIRNLALKTVFRLPHPDAVRDYLYIDDVVDLLIAASEQIEKQKGEVFNVGSGREVHAMEVVETIARNLSAETFLRTLPLTEGPLGPIESTRWVADTKKTSGVFSWTAQTALSDGLGRTIDWTLRHP